MKAYSQKIFKQTQLHLEAISKDEKLLNEIDSAVDTLVKTIQANGHVFAFGNGGSMSDATHFSAEFARIDFRGFVIPLSDAATITAIGNDYGYDNIFTHYLINRHATTNDCIFAISTSGESLNVISAAKQCRKNEVPTISLTGTKNSTLEKYSDICICTNTNGQTERTQELHTVIIHIITDLVGMELRRDVENN